MRYRVLLYLFVVILLIFNFGKKSFAGDKAEWEYKISHIKIVGNEKTKIEVILNELTFTYGSMLTPAMLEAELENSRVNLINTSLFINHLVSLTWEKINRSEVGILISVQERWYIWPEPIIKNGDRNFNTWLQDHKLSKLSYGVNFIHENFRGTNERLSVICQLGYDEKLEINLQVPTFFYGRDWGFNVGGGFQQNRQVPFRETNNKLEYIEGNSVLKKYGFGYFQLNLRPSQRHFQTFRLVASTFILDSLLINLNPGYSPGGAAKVSQLDFIWLLKLDNRNHRSYPLYGSYFDMQFRRNALFSSVKSDIASSAIEVNGRKYFKLSPRLYYAAGATGYINSKINLPFMFRQGLGYSRNYVRGFEYNTIHGSKWALLKQNIKLAVLSERKFTASFFSFPKFKNGTIALYCNVFADAGYVYESSETATLLNNKLLFSGGAGLDFVTYYDKVLRLEWSMTNSKTMGLFINFIAPI